MDKREIPDLESKLLEDVRHLWGTAQVLAQAYLGSVRTGLDHLYKRWTDWLTGNDLWSSNEIKISSNNRVILPTAVMTKDHLAYISPEDVEKFIFGINRVERLTLKQASAYLEIGELDFKECLDSIGRGIAYIENGQIVIDKDAWREWKLRRRWAEKRGQDYQDKLFQSLGLPSIEPAAPSDAGHEVKEPTQMAAIASDEIAVDSNDKKTRSRKKRGRSHPIEDKMTLDSMTDDEILRYLEANGSIGGEIIA